MIGVRRARARERPSEVHFCITGAGAGAPLQFVTVEVAFCITAAAGGVLLRF